MIKKYEIIMDGSNKRIKALRSFHVQGRYVNIGDVGGIVYDENTLSQEGNCWIFRGNLGFPGARIGGDSIVDVGEATLSATGAPNVDILGSSVVAGGKLLFEAERTAADNIVLTGVDFEQGTISYTKGANWETWKAQSVQSVRLKAPIFAGGTATTLKVSVPGYKVRAFVLDRDGLGIAITDAIETGEGVTLGVPAGQYFTLTLEKNPAAAIVPADAAKAAITFTGTYETRLSIVDSRVEINQVTGTRISSIKPGGRIVGASYPEAIIRNSKVSVNASAAANATFRLMGQIIESNVTVDATAGEAQISGIYSNVKNLMVSGIMSVGLGVVVYNAIQVTDCNDFAISPTVFPGYAAGISANMPFTFIRCNVPSGVFYHNAKVMNTYTDIDFAKAQADLGKTTANGYVLCSAEVEGMYRLYSKIGSLFGALVETHDSVKSLKMEGSANAYNTTIYKDAYFRGKIDFIGTNVFGNKVPKHSRAVELKAKPRVVQGTLNTVVIGETITGVAPSDTSVVTPIRYRINSGKAISVKNMPAGIKAQIVAVNERNVIEGASDAVSVNTDFTTYAAYTYAFVIFSKTGDATITPDDLGETTITVYNGCKIVNTGTTSLSMKGNIRVEDNATLVNASVTGSGYFGGNSVTENAYLFGSAYVTDNGVFSPTPEEGKPDSDIHIEDNAKFLATSRAGNTVVYMCGDSEFSGTLAFSTVSLAMYGKSRIAGKVSGRGILILEDNADTSDKNVEVYGCIRLVGNYRQTKEKVWTGRRTISSENAPGYDDNVKTQYDF